MRPGLARVARSDFAGPTAHAAMIDAEIFGSRLASQQEARAATVRTGWPWPAATSARQPRAANLNSGRKGSVVDLAWLDAGRIS